MSPASFCVVDFGGTSAMRGELKTFHVSPGVGGFFTFLSLPFKQSKILLSVVGQILKV